MNAITEGRSGRPTREEATKTERRRRKAGGITNKLQIPADVLAKHPDKEFYWAKDDEGRMQQLTVNDDWDKVPDVQPIHAGTGAGGHAIKHHLLMKPKAFVEQDRAEKLRVLDELEQSALARPEAKQAIAQGADMYSVPGNKL